MKPKPTGRHTGISHRKGKKMLKFMRVGKDFIPGSKLVIGD